MAIELKIPSVGESVTEAYIDRWLKEEGDHVEKDEIVCELESEKAGFELPAPESGTLSKIVKQDGEEAAVGDVIGYIETGDDEDASSDEEESADAEEEKPEETSDETEEAEKETSEEASDESTEDEEKKEEEKASEAKDESEKEKKDASSDEKSSDESESSSAPKRETVKEPAAIGEGDRREQAVRMSPMRRTIGKHLVKAQSDAALLTTFNEVDMTAVKQMRTDLGPTFKQRYGVKLGFMSFFVRAAVDALKQFPEVNARLDGDDLIYRNYCDIGVAVSTDRGLVVPVLRDADRLSFAQIESKIGDYADRAREDDLEMEELRGGTFTITNGGVFGSLLSTPIVNPPQTAVLGMHTIQERPVAIDGQVVVRPMMYLALTYDHRVIDGKEAVQFLGRVKDAIENPSRMLLEA
ncbi:MAG: 2-oxoglutarate dehydrogenase complex dihydrolipoyllysine-residue succinyltransferase [Phycisphaeraceae bacterium]|nr:2-oxoglutarate dehydrogenase complex dihydrolipoyllysine-residue succinyltransferase [Phycisphaeraceae bacterium]